MIRKGNVQRRPRKKDGNSERGITEKKTEGQEKIESGKGTKGKLRRKRLTKQEDRQKAGGRGILIRTKKLGQEKRVNPHRGRGKNACLRVRWGAQNSGVIDLGGERPELT